MMKRSLVQNNVLSHVAMKQQISASPSKIFCFIFDIVTGNVVGQPLPYAIVMTSVWTGCALRTEQTVVGSDLPRSVATWGFFWMRVNWGQDGGGPVINVWFQADEKKLMNNLN